MVEQITFFKTDLPSELLRMIQHRHQVAALLVGDEGFGKSRILTGLTNKLSNLHIPHVQVDCENTPIHSKVAMHSFNTSRRNLVMSNCIFCGSNMENYPLPISVCNPKLLDRATQQLRKLLQERAQVILIDDLHFAQELSLPIFRQLWDRLAIQLNLPLVLFH